MDLIVLVCVVTAALAVGVLGAYGLCTVMFAAFRMHALQATVKQRCSTSTVTASVQTL